MLAKYLEVEIQGGDTSGDQRCTSEVHTVSVTPVIRKALNAVSRLQSRMVCNSTRSCSLDHLLKTKAESWNKLSRISELSGFRKCPEKLTDKAAEPRLVAPCWRGAPPLEREILWEQSSEHPSATQMPLWMRHLPMGCA
jgi:hypothetical protein